MSDSCTTSVSTDRLAINCPSCQRRGLSVELRTVKAILTEPALSRVQCVSHRFCRTAACGVVYYDETGAAYERADVRVRVSQKEPIGDRPMCYCFGESEGTIRDEFTRTGRCDAVERVRRHVEATRCACDVRNPRGVCCLGDLAAAVERVRRELIIERSVR